MTRATLLACLLALACAPAAAGAPWTKPLTLAPDGQATFVAADGPHVVAVWTQRVGDRPRLRAATRGAGGQFTHSRWLSDTASFAPGAAVRPDGTGVLVWQEAPEGEDPRVVAAELAADGTIGPAATLSAPGRRGEGPVAVAGANGDIVVAWSELVTGDSQVMAIVAPAGRPLPPPVVVALDGVGPQVAVGADGRAVITWRASAPPRHQYDYSCVLRAAERPPGGAFGEPQDMGFDEACDAVPLVGVGRGGETTAVWDRLTLEDDHIVMGNWRAPGGGAFGRPRTLSGKGPASLSGYGLRTFDAHPGGAAAAGWWMRGKKDRVQMALREPGERFGRPFTAAVVDGTEPYANFLWRTKGQGVLLWRQFHRRHAVVRARTIGRRGRLGRIEVVSSMPPRYDIDYASGFPMLARDGRGGLWTAYLRADGRVQVAYRKG